MTRYNKLVRDKIPEILKNKNLNPITHTADNKEYWEKLKEKLHEEVNEFLEENNKEELADILEVIESITNHLKISREDLEETKNKKAEERGKFINKTILEEV